MLLASAIVTLLGARHLSGQVAPAPSHKSPLAAGLLEWFTVPTVGYAYAGDWSRGIPSGLVRLTGFGLVLSAVNVDEPVDDACGGRCALGLAMFLGGSAWAVIDAVNTAERENDRRRSTSAGVSALPTIVDGRVGFRVQIALGL
jgi:hypothetical protein